MTLIAPIAAIKTRAPFAPNIEEALLTHLTHTAQEMHMRALLGGVLYNELLTHVRTSGTNSVYTTLINGGTYTRGGKVLEFSGIATVIAYFTYSEYAYTGGVRDTPFGLVQKQYEDGTPVSSSLAFEMGRTYIAKANAVFEPCREYMAFAGLHRSACDATSTYFRFKKISI